MKIQPTAKSMTKLLESIPFKKLCLLLIPLVSASWVSPALSNDRTAEELVLEGLLKPELYNGFKGKIVDQDPKWYCNDRRYFWSLKWNAKLDDVKVTYDPSKPDVTTIDLTLKDSALRANYFKKGGALCSWSGGEGTIEAGKIFTTISIHASIEEDGVPEFSLDDLSVKDIEIRNVEVLYASVFSAGFKQASDGFADWVEQNLNKVIKGLLQSSLKQRLNKAINDRVNDAIGNGALGRGIKSSGQQSKELP